MALVYFHITRQANHIQYTICTIRTGKKDFKQKKWRKQNHILSPCINKSQRLWHCCCRCCLALLWRRLKSGVLAWLTERRASWPIVWAKSCKLPPPSASLWLHFAAAIKLHLQHSQRRSHAPRKQGRIRGICQGRRHLRLAGECP